MNKLKTSLVVAALSVSAICTTQATQYEFVARCRILSGNATLYECPGLVQPPSCASAQSPNFTTCEAWTHRFDNIFYGPCPGGAPTPYSFFISGSGGQYLIDSYTPNYQGTCDSSMTDSQSFQLPYPPCQRALGMAGKLQTWMDYIVNSKSNTNESESLVFWRYEAGTWVLDSEWQIKQ